MSGAAIPGEKPTVDVFCSYARVDLTFAREVVDSLRALDKSVWVDLEGLYAGEKWWDSIRTAIEAAEAFVFLVSPASAASVQCRAEVEHAVACGKRIVPVLHEPVKDVALPDAIASTQWLLDFAANGDRATAAKVLVRVLETDTAWVRAHTRWLQRAVEWDGAGRSAELLMTPAALDEVTRWEGERGEGAGGRGQGKGKGRDPDITALQRAYAQASRRGALFTKARRILTAGGRDDDALAEAVSGAREADASLPPSELATLFACVQRVRRAFPLRAHESPVTGLAIDQAGMRALSSSEDPFAALWVLDEDRPRLLARLEGASGSRLELPLLSPDGSIALTWTGGLGRLWDTRTGEAFAPLDLGDGVESMAFSADGRLLIGAQTRGATVWNTHTGNVVAVLDSHRDDYCFQAWLSPDGARALTVAGLSVRGWDVASGAELYRASGGRMAFRSARWSPDGTRIITTKGTRTIQCRDGVTGDECGRFDAAKGDELENAWFVSGGLVAAIMSPSTLALWREADGKRLAVPGAHDLIGTFAVSPDGTRLATASGDASGRVRLWSTTRNALVETFTAHRDEVLALAWSPDGERLVTAGRDGTARIWAMDTLSTSDVLEPHAGTIFVARYERDGRGVLLGCENGAVVRWRFDPTLATGIPADYVRPAVAETRGGAHLLLQRIGEPSMDVLDASDRQVLLTFGDDTVRCDSAALAPDGRRLCLAETLFDVRGRVFRQVGRRARIIELPSGQAHEVTLDEPGGDTALEQLSFSPDGTLVLAIESSSAVPSLFDAATGAPVRAIGSMDDGRTRGAVFSPDGTRVLTLADRLNVWLAASGERLATHPAADACDIVFSPDGTTFVTRGPHTAALWSWPGMIRLAELADGIDYFPVRAEYVDAGQHVVIVDGSRRGMVMPATLEPLLELATTLLGEPEKVRAAAEQL